MCGICGKVAFDHQQPADPSMVRRMMHSLHHRGPDDEGMYVGSQVVLGHRRLSIIDLSTGKQPISNEDRSIWIVYNGEIYNFQDLREELIAKGHDFITESDTEVIVHLYEEYGTHCLEKLRGMFAFALWDERKKALFLARDRVGIKPLYYGLVPGGLVFASEIKALLLDPFLSREIDAQTIDTFFTFLYAPGSGTLFRQVKKLEPGHYLWLQHGTVTVERYWDLLFPSQEESDCHFSVAVDELISLLQETVRDHMISDVPVGVLLSGGVDSTALLSFALDETNKDVKTFTIGFHDEKFSDERLYAKLAADKFGSEHYELSISSREFAEFLPKYVWHMEEPICEPPAVALYYVSKLASEYVKVLISGEGGDEAFAGYQNYRNLIWLERLKKLGGPWRNVVATCWDRLSRLPSFGRFGKYSQLMRVPLQDYYLSRTASPSSFFNRNRATLFSEGFRHQIKSNGSIHPTRQLFSSVAGREILNQMLYIDTKTWLPDDLLLKADKITMANSIELRVPLLDHKVLEFAAQLPAKHKVRRFTTKFILKKAFQDRIPSQIIHRKKTGFPVPLESWFQRELAHFACDLLTDNRTLERGYFEKKTIRNLVENPANLSRYAPEIFSLIILELWHRCFFDTYTPLKPAQSL